MVTIVIKDDSITQEDIKIYIEKEHITEDYEVITFEEYQSRKAKEPTYLFRLPPHYGEAESVSAQLERIEQAERDFKNTQQKCARRCYNRMQNFKSRKR